ncbi:MAG: beta-propeller domain-containing protein [Nitrosopumilaceae archaeon]
MSTKYQKYLLLVATIVAILSIIGFADLQETKAQEQSGADDVNPWQVFSKSQVLKPVDIAFDANDNMYVLHSANRIKVIDPSGKITSSWDTLTEFTKGSALAVDKNGNVFVIASDVNKILKYDYTKKLILEWPLDENQSFSTLDGILDFDIDNNGNMYIADMAGNRILKVDINGNLVTTWGTKGKNDGQFSNPKGVFVDDMQNVYISDSNNYRVQKFDSEGKLLSLTKELRDNRGLRIVPESIAVDSSGNIFVSNDDAKAQDLGDTYIGAAGNVGKVWKLAPDGKILDDWFAGVTIRSLEFNHAGELFAADIATNQILHLNAESKNIEAIPSWIKNNAKWWSEGSIGDSDFVKGIEYLIQQETIKIPVVKPSTSFSLEIPAWIKNNAKWWSEGSIGDSDFISGIQFLIGNGMIRVNQSDCQGTALCIKGVVEKIVDGDTINVSGYKVRLSLVDTPETNEVGFREATEFTSTLCPVGTSIIVDQDDLQPFDVYGRIVGKVTCSGKLLNSELLYNGYAKILTEYCRESEFSGEAWAIKYGC